MVQPIVAAVDGSQASLHALDWAADEAALLRLPLQLVHVALTWSYQAPATKDAAAVAPDEAGLRLLDAAAERATTRSPGIEVETSLLVGPAAVTLLGAAQTARLMVLGRRGSTGFAGQLVGAVGYQVAAHAPCSVALIPSPDSARARGEIVLGVDGAPGGASVIEFAFAEAALRGAKLRAIHSWTHGLAGQLLAAGSAHGTDAMAAAGARLLAESVAGWREKYPDVQLSEQVERGHAAKILTDASADAGLVVVGARGKGGFPGLALGSVAHGIVHHAHCPVAVVRPPR